MDDETFPTIRNLYPDLSETELVEAESNMERYLALVLRIFEREESRLHARVADQLTPKTGKVSCTRSESSAPHSPQP